MQDKVPAKIGATQISIKPQDRQARGRRSYCRFGDTWCCQRRVLNTSKEGQEYSPLTRLREKAAAVGKYSRGYFKRGGVLPKGTLTSRMTDGPSGPLSPRDLSDTIHFICSAVRERPRLLAINGASAALWRFRHRWGPIGAVRVGASRSVRR